LPLFFGFLIQVFQLSPVATPIHYTQVRKLVLKIGQLFYQGRFEETLPLHISEDRQDLLVMFDEHQTQEESVYCFHGLQLILIGLSRQEALLYFLQDHQGFLMQLMHQLFFVVRRSKYAFVFKSAMTSTLFLELNEEVDLHVLDLCLSLVLGPKNVSYKIGNVHHIRISSAGFLLLK
jgi:hypothetical protein